MDVHTSPSNGVIISLGEEFVLRKGQKAVLAGTGFELEILRFYNQPCPPNVKCIWSGIGIEFEYRNNSQVARGINLVRAFGFVTTIIKSDYESYAILKMTRDVN